MLHVARAALADILPLRRLYLREMNAQVRYDSVHARGWSDSYLLYAGECGVGYGAIMGQQTAARDTIFEWYVAPPWRQHSHDLFAALVAASGAHLIESQTNDPCLYPRALACCTDLKPTVFFFESGDVQDLPGPGAVRRRRDDDAPFAHTTEPLGSHVLEVEGEIVATGGFLLHYNAPFADVYMEVAPGHRGRGYGARLVAGVMRACWLAGRVPAARCSIGNTSSRATLLKAGMREIGQMMFGEIDRARIPVRS